MIAIPNMDKPKRCRGCFAEYDTIFCKILGERIPDDGVRSDCPLIDIVRCGECEYWSKDKQGNTWCEHAIGGLTKADDFCSYGERRADEHTDKRD